MQHTPGPWNVMKAEDSNGNVGWYVLGDTDICDLYHYWHDEHGIKRDLVPFENSEANAKLIAAAPDLLAASEMPRSSPRPTPQTSECPVFPTSSDTLVAGRKPRLASPYQGA